MDIGKLEAFLKAQCVGDFLDMHVELNDHKSCYGTILEHERNYTNIVYKWVSEKEREAAYAADEMWTASWCGAADNTYRTNAAHKLAAVLKYWGEIDEETAKQAEELTAFLLTQLKGKYTSAHITYTVGQKVSRQVGRTWVDSVDNIATMIAEGDNFGDEEDWVSVEDRQKAIDNNGVWSVQIYPNTPVGFYIYHGSSLQVLIDFLMQPD